MRKAITVVKKRTGSHETAIRELKLGPQQLHIGGPLTAFHGILTGVPQYTGSATSLLSDETHH
jgi:circadian clock protein KaiC